MQRLPRELFKSIEQHGIRNSHLTAIAPTGTISLFAGNVSSGLEPVYAWEYQRNVMDASGGIESLKVTDPAYNLYRDTYGEEAPLPDSFVTEVSAEDQLLMQAALQAHVDNAISKTVSVPECLDFESFASLYERAYALGLKGCTAFRPNPVTGRVILDQTHCCTTDREPD